VPKGGICISACAGEPETKTLVWQPVVWKGARKGGIVFRPFRGGPDQGDDGKKGEEGTVARISRLGVTQVTTGTLVR